MSNNLFRNESLDNLNTPGQINDFVKVTTPPLYIVLMAMTICSVVVCLWIAFGTVTEHVQSVAVVFPHATPHRVSCDKDGTVASIIATKGSNVDVGSPLVVVRHGDECDTLVSNICGRLINLKNVDDTFRPYETIAEIIPDTKSAVNRELITYVEYKDLRSLQPGQEVQVTPVDLHREDYGYIRGHITNVNHFPANIEEAKQRSAVRNFVDNIFPTETAYEVRLVVDTSKDDPRLLDWSRQKSRDIRLSSMSFCNVQIITGSKPVYRVVLKN